MVETRHFSSARMNTHLNLFDILDIGSLQGECLYGLGFKASFLCEFQVLSARVQLLGPQDLDPGG